MHSAASNTIPHVYANHIGGEAVDAASGDTFVAVNPTTGEPWGRFAKSGATDIDRAVQAAVNAVRSGPWAALAATRRGRLLMRWGDEIAGNAELVARLESEQNGKLMSELRSQARVAQDWLYYFGGLADKVQGSVVPVERPSVMNYTLREPIGVVGVILPWNSPTLVIMMAAAPALAAGNTVVIKPSEVASASAIELARMAERAGFPPGVINVVTGFREAGEALVDHPLVAKVNFTGGDAGGRAVAAGTGRRLASCVLELGGKSPNIVFADANLDAAEAGVLSGIFAAAGQSCVAGSRAYVQRPVYDQFVERLVGRARAIRIGDPTNAATQMGPIATQSQLEKDESMVRRAVADGGELLCGGRRPHIAQFPNGFFFEPTIVSVASQDNFLIQNEVFGPVLTVTPFDSVDEVVALANGTVFGLAAGVWTRDFGRAHVMARRLQAGTIWLNTYRTMAYSSPFGGYKSSGIGRQNGIDAIEQYLQTKSVWCELSEQVQDPFVVKL
jgi:acyl-CoA reductase-like NAD-dependent aldehyde dehydrogenase